MGPKNNKAETTRLASLPASLSQNLSGMSRPAVGPPLVPFNELENINFFVAGGNESTVEKAESILEELAARKLPVSGIAIKSRERGSFPNKGIAYYGRWKSCLFHLQCQRGSQIMMIV